MSQISGLNRCRKTTAWAITALLEQCCQDGHFIIKQKAERNSIQQLWIQWSAVACGRKILFTRNFSAASSLFLSAAATERSKNPCTVAAIISLKNAFGTSAFGINCSLRKFCRRDALLQKFSAFYFFLRISCASFSIVLPDLKCEVLRLFLLSLSFEVREK